MTAGIHRPFTPAELAAQRIEKSAMDLLVIAEAFGTARARAKAPVTTEWHVERELRAAAQRYADAVKETAHE